MVILFIVQVKSGIAGEADMKIITRQMKDRISQFKTERQRKIEEAAKDEAAKEAQQQQQLQQQQQQPGVPMQVRYFIMGNFTPLQTTNQLRYAYL